MANGMKMLVIATSTGFEGDSPGVTGGELRWMEMARFWQKQGHEVHVLCGPGGQLLCEKMGLDLECHLFERERERHRFSYFSKLARSLVYLPEGVRSQPWDIVYSTSEQVYDVLPGWKLKRKLGQRVRWATVVHWLPPFPPWRRKASSLLNSTLYFGSERAGVNLAKYFGDVLLPVSEGTAQQLYTIRVKRSKVVPVACGVHFEETQRLASAGGPKRYDAVFMKRLQAVKGVFDLIEIWERVVKERPNAQLAIIGGGVDGAKAREMVKAKGLEENIHFLGIIYDLAQKFGALGQSKLFVLPSYEENWAISMGEAMAAGLPVVCYDLPELRVVWQDSYVPIPVGDKQAFAGAVLRLLADEPHRQEMADRAQAYVKQYDWEDIAATELDIICRSPAS